MNKIKQLLKDKPEHVSDCSKLAELKFCLSTNVFILLQECMFSLIEVFGFVSFFLGKDSTPGLTSARQVFYRELHPNS